MRHRFRHASYEVVILQQIGVGLSERGGKGEIPFFQHVRKSLFSKGTKKLDVRKGVQVEELHFPHGKGGFRVKGHTEKRAGAQDMMPGGVFAEILQ